MSTSHLPPGTAQPAAARLLLPVLTTAIFLSAALLFAVQPMFTKMVLPRLGGAPQVWSVAMVFFQAALLAGYAYAHLLTRYAPGRQSLFIQLAVMVAACFMLPLSIASGWGKPPAVGEAFWLLGPFGGSTRPAVLRARRQQPSFAGLFRAQRSPGRKGSVFPLCREQCRKLPRAVVLSADRRAADPPLRPDLAVDDRLLYPHPPDRGQRL